MNTLDKIRRHQGKSIKEKIGEDEFEFKPLGWDYIGDFFALGKKGEGKGVESLDEETVSIMKGLVFNFVKNSFEKPEELTEESWNKELQSFCATNLTRLMEIMFKVHDFGQPADLELKQTLETLRKAKEDASGIPEEKKP